MPNNLDKITAEKQSKMENHFFPKIEKTGF